MPAEYADRLAERLNPSFPRWLTVVEAYSMLYFGEVLSKDQRAFFDWMLAAQLATMVNEDSRAQIEEDTIDNLIDSSQLVKVYDFQAVQQAVPVGRRSTQTFLFNSSVRKMMKSEYVGRTQIIPRKELSPEIDQIVRARTPQATVEEPVYA